MMMRQKSTTSYPVQFLLVDTVDHITGKTGLTPTVTISKNGSVFGAAAGAVTELANGVYSWAGNAGDRDTLGELMVHISAAGADPVDMKILVVDFDPVSAVGAILEDTSIDGVMLNSDSLSDIWAVTPRTLTQSAASVVAVVSGSDITATRGDTLSASLTDVGALTGYSKLYFTVKSDKADADTASIIQIEKTAGLKYINGAVAVTAANGVLAITDEASGDITITLDEVETAKLSPGRYYYDVQVVRTAGTVSTLTEGVFNVSADVTRATT